MSDYRIVLLAERVCRVHALRVAARVAIRHSWGEL